MLSRSVVSLLAFFALQSSALNYGYHPDSALALGIGFNPADLSVAKPRCIDYDKIDKLNGEGSTQAQVDITLIKSQRDLYSKIGFSAEMSAQGFFAKGSAKTSFLDEYEFHDDTTHFAIIAWTDHGRQGLNNPRLTPHAQGLIDSGRYEDFAKRCGTHYVFEESRHSTVIAIYTIKQMNEEKKRKFEASFDVGFTFADLKIKGTFESFMREAFHMNNVNLRVFTIGGSGVTDLSDLVTNHTEPEKVKEVLRDYVSKMTDKKGVPSRFKAASMDAFGWVDHQNVATLKRDIVLKEYFFLIKGLSDKKSRLNDVLLNRDTDYAYLPDESVLSYEHQAEKLATDLDNLMTSATECFEEPTRCKTPTYRSQSIKWPVEAIVFDGDSRIFRMRAGSPEGYMAPVFSKEECNKQRSAAFLSGCITAQELKDLRRLNGAPSCSLVGDLVSWGLCE